MNKKLQVFVSSTYTDMLTERQAAVEAILRAGHIPAGMELFAAGDASQWDVIRGWIDDSDVFMLILGGRYGTIAPNSVKSYVQLEYEYAVEKKKPLFAALVSEEYLEQKVKVVGLDATERKNSSLLNTFREAVTRKICRFFKDINELKLIVFESLAQFDRKDELSGWVRGKDIIDPKPILEEVARLQAENLSLHQYVNELKTVQASSMEATDEELANRLTDDAKSLLVEASKSEGFISCGLTSAGWSVYAGGKNFVDPPLSARENARWIAGIEELAAGNMLRGTGEGNYHMVKRGYDVVDILHEQG